MKKCFQVYLLLPEQNGCETGVFVFHERWSFYFKNLFIYFSIKFPCKFYHFFKIYSFKCKTLFAKLEKAIILTNI